MRARYVQRYDNKPFEIKSQELTRWACCDCGLVHDIVFATLEPGQSIGVAAKRNNRATAGRRRKWKQQGLTSWQTKL